MDGAVPDRSDKRRLKMKAQKNVYVKVHAIWPASGFVAVGSRSIEYRRARKIVRFLKKRGRYAFTAEAA